MSRQHAHKDTYHRRGIKSILETEEDRDEEVGVEEAEVAEGKEEEGNEK
jgi:hypothetical protein